MSRGFPAHIKGRSLGPRQRILGSTLPEPIRNAERTPKNIKCQLPAWTSHFRVAWCSSWPSRWRRASAAGPQPFRITRTWRRQCQWKLERPQLSERGVEVEDETTNRLLEELRVRVTPAAATNRWLADWVTASLVWWILLWSWAASAGVWSRIREKPKECVRSGSGTVHVPCSVEGRGGQAVPLLEKALQSSKGVKIFLGWKVGWNGRQWKGTINTNHPSSLWQGRQAQAVQLSCTKTTNTRVVVSRGRFVTWVLTSQIST